MNNLKSTNQTPSLRDILTHLLLHYVAITVFFLGFDVLVGKELRNSLSLVPFIAFMLYVIKHTHNKWDWLNGVKVTSVFAAIAIVFEVIYQLTVSKTSLVALVPYPVITLLILAIAWVIHTPKKRDPAPSQSNT